MIMRPLKVTRSQWSLGHLLVRLEANGLIRRGADAPDRRVKRVFFTRAGTRLIMKMHQRSHEMSERILEGLDVVERHKLAALLGRVKQNLMAISRDKR
jgi:MarR family transcriptional regulator for hemolysin